MVVAGMWDELWLWALWLGCGMSCACGWDKLCSGGRAATVGILAVLQ